MDETKVKQALDKLIDKVDEQKADFDKKLEGVDLKEIGANKEAIESQKADLEKQKAELVGIRDALEKFTRQMSVNRVATGNFDPNYKGGFDNEKMAGNFGLFALAKFHPDAAVRQSCAKRFCETGYKIRSSQGQFVSAENFIKALSSSADTSGGFLVPDEFIPALIRHVNTFGTMRQWLQPVPMGRERVSIPKRTGGLTVYYPDMGKAPTESDLSFGLVTLTAKKWAVLTFIDEELDEDAVIDIGNLVAIEMALAIAIAEDTNGFMGDGTNTFAGIVGVFESANVAKVPMPATKTAFTDLTDTDLVNLKYGVPKWARQMPDAAYYCSSDIAGLIENVKDGDGRPLYQQPTDAFPLRVHGSPVREVEVLPETGDTAVDKKFIAYGSLRAWGALGTRRSMQIKRSNEVKFLEGQITVMGVLRQDIQEREGEAMATLATAAA